jgi:hypothetical protein
MQPQTKCHGTSLGTVEKIGRARKRHNPCTSSMSQGRRLRLLARKILQMRPSMDLTEALPRGLGEHLPTLLRTFPTVAPYGVGG